VKPGDRVFHTTLGRGVVTKIVEIGACKKAWVNFVYAKDLLNTEELEPLPVLETLDDLPVTGPDLTGEPSPAPGEDSAEFDSFVSESTDSLTEARKGVVALRLGQVLESQVLQLSVGTAQIQASLRRAVSQVLRDQPTCILVEGAWGGGKTHALTLLQAIARREDMVTATAVMDGVGVSLSDPMQLMEEIISSFCFPKECSSDSLAQLLRRAMTEGKLPAIEIRGARVVADALRRLPAGVFDDPEALQVIEGYFSLSLSASQAKSKLRALRHSVTGLPTIRAARIAERAGAFALLLVNWAKLSAVMGARGLLVVLDELDVDYAATAYCSRTSIGQKEKRQHMLEQVKALSEHRAPLLIAFASAPAGPGIDSSDDAVENVRQTLGQGLIHIQVPMPTEAELGELLAKLASLYRGAYLHSTQQLNEEHIPGLLNGLLERYHRNPNSVPRHFVRMAIEVFDLLTVGEQSLGDVGRLLRMQT
jgi:hypothetical protein